MNENLKKSLLFAALTYAGSYLILFVYRLLGGRWTMPGALLVTVAYMFVPMIAALIVQKGIYRERVREPLGISLRVNRWFLVAWLLPVILACVTLGVSLLLPGVTYTSEPTAILERLAPVMTSEQALEVRDQVAALPIPPFWLALVQGLVAGATVNAVVAFGEELGWRGFLQRHLAYLGFWRSAAVTGVVWGFWHAPLILQGHNYPQHPVAGVLMMVVFTLLLSPIFAYVRLQARSVIAAAILHGTLNAVAGLALIAIRGGNDLMVGLTGLAGFAALFAANIALVLYDRQLAKEPLLRPRMAPAGKGGRLHARG